MTYPQLVTLANKTFPGFNITEIMTGYDGFDDPIEVATMSEYELPADIREWIKTEVLAVGVQISQFNNFEIALPADVVRLCHHTGDCDEDVIRCLELPEVATELAKLDPAKLRTELAEYGAWDDTELASHTDNLKRILWIAAGNIQDEAAV